MLKNYNLLNDRYCIVGISLLNPDVVYEKIVPEANDVNKLLEELNDDDTKGITYFGYKIEKAKLL